MQVCDVLVNLKLFVLHQLALEGKHASIFNCFIGSSVTKLKLRYCKNENN